MKPMKKLAYRPDIDGLRAISILAVLAYHGFPSLLPGGFIGVDVFFVISGYLITGSILSDLEQNRFSFASFYARRIRRIFPALALVLVFVYAAAWIIFFPAEFEQLGKHITGSALFVANFVLLDESGYFDNAANSKPLLHLWSLGIEEQYYLLWPLFMALIWRRKKTTLLVTTLLIVASFINSIQPDTYSNATPFYSPLSRLWELAVGAAIAQIQHGYRIIPLANLGLRWPLSKRTFLVVRNSAGALGVVSIIGATYLVPIAGIPGWWTLLPICGSALVVCAGPRSWTNRQILAKRPLVLLGLISYPLYLWHWPLLSFAWTVYGGAPPVAITCILLGISLLFAWLTFVLLERPVRWFAFPRYAVSGLIAIVALMASVGLWTVQEGGFPRRAVAEINSQLAIDIATPTDTRRSDGSCQKYFAIDQTSHKFMGIDLESAEVCLASSNSPHILVLGDSHSMAMYSAIYEGVEHEDAVLVATHSGNWAQLDCIKSESMDIWLTGSAPCQNVVRNALTILALRPTIATVVFVACQDNPFFADREKMSALQNAIIAMNKKVVWLEPVPTLESPARCSLRTVEVFGIRFKADVTGDPCRMKRTTIVDGGKVWTHHIEDMARSLPTVYAYDPIPIFCDAEYCRQTDQQGELYWILGHLNVRGSARLLHVFLPWLEKNGLLEVTSIKR